MSRILYLRCTQNSVEDDMDGGVVLFQSVSPAYDPNVIEARVVMNFTHDLPMRDYPVTRDDKQNRYFKVTLEEITADDLPVRQVPVFILNPLTDIAQHLAASSSSPPDGVS